MATLVEFFSQSKSKKAQEGGVVEIVTKLLKCKRALFFVTVAYVCASVLGLSFAWKLWISSVTAYLFLPPARVKFVYKKGGVKSSASAFGEVRSLSLQASMDAAISACVSKGIFSTVPETVFATVENDDNIQDFAEKIRHKHSCTTKCHIYIGEVRLVNPSSVDDMMGMASSFEASSRVQAYYRLRISIQSSRWYIWRTYSRFDAVYRALVTAYPSVAIPKLLPALNHRNTVFESSVVGRAAAIKVESMNKEEALGNSSSNAEVLTILPSSTSSTFIPESSSSSSSRKQYEEIVLRAEQTLMTNWIQALQRNIMLANDPRVRELLQLDDFEEEDEAEEWRDVGGESPKSNSKGKSTENTRTKVTSDASQSQPAANVSSSSINPSSEPKNWTGTSIADFRFTDEHPSARAMYSDCSYTHGFKVRGSTYKKDRRKVDAGSAVAKLLLMELFEVEPRHGDRIDHIASKGKAK